MTMEPGTPQIVMVAWPEGRPGQSDLVRDEHDRVLVFGSDEAAEEWCEANALGGMCYASMNLED